ncbi:MAG TPA: peptidylprolyl isomerase [Gemmatimonadales bacterium]|jgi:cyclophilin family peptidyl-prolyl cis-trans isomerase/HEAT repeat protein
MKIHLLVVALACASSPALAAQTPDTILLQRILVAEDARGTGAEGVTPLLDGARSADSLIRRVSIRGIGRLQRPDMAAPLLAGLSDAAPAVRAEAANAIAQSLVNLRRGATSADPAKLDVPAAQRALTAALASESDADATGSIAESLGRLHYGDSIAPRDAERAIVAKSNGDASAGELHGLYWLALTRRVTGSLTPDGLALLRRSASAAPDTIARRIAVLALTAAGGLDSATRFTASNDADDQVRRLALAASGGLSAQVRAAMVGRAIADASPIVRIGAIGAARVGAERPDCGPIMPLLRDPSDYVALTAIDALGLPCSDNAAAAAALEMTITSRPHDVIPGHNWQAPAHALVALAGIDSVRAANFLPRFAQSRVWEERMFAATAAGKAHQERLLRVLSHDSEPNVVEAAITALAHDEGRGADSVLIGALTSSGYQVTLEAATALQGTHDPRALPALLAAFQRVTGERRENARDPRLMMLKRIAELGGAANASEMEPYLADFDTTVATTVAGMLSQWTGRTVSARPLPLTIHPEPLAAVMLAREVRLRVTMSERSGGGRFVITMMTGEAPATVARIARLAREHYYDGHRFQRVEPNFVVQGGGPAATEYVGDAAFMRDELGRPWHLRGTLGISSRGRDTGDAQWFINLTDNIRLDHEYTVCGWITEGPGVAERILEDDQIARVEVLGLR